MNRLVSYQYRHCGGSLKQTGGIAGFVVMNNGVADMAYLSF
ncbi:MAG: hypothetical protein WBP22_02190 [Candidatus Saccharimonas sp.]